MSAVARRHGLSPQQLFGWRRDARRAVTQRGAGDRTVGSSPAFASVIVEAAQPRTQVPIATVQLSGSPMIEIVIGSAIIRIPPGTDAASLATVLCAVKAAA